MDRGTLPPQPPLTDRALVEQCRLPTAVQNSGNCRSTGGGSLRRVSGRANGVRVPNLGASTAVSTVRAGLARDAIIGSSGTAGVGSGGPSAEFRILLFSAWI